MIGRGAFGNPWVFEKIKTYLETGNKSIDVGLAERLEIIKEHLKLEINEKGEDVAIREFRKHLSAYTKNLPDSSKFRSVINTIDNKKELEQILNQYFESKIN